MTWFMLKMAWRETRAAWRHFLYFLVCIAVGVGALVAVSLFGANVEGAVTREARSLLGGDLEVRWSRSMSSQSQTVLDSLKDRGIAITHVSELVGMAGRSDRHPRGGSPTQIIELKAVEPGYPLYGAVRLEPNLPLPDLLAPSSCDHTQTSSSVSASSPTAPYATHFTPDLSCYGAVVQESLLIRMRLAVGDQIKVGQGWFVITGVVRTEPDRTANAFSLGPRVLISQEGLRAAALVKAGSRIRERYLLKIPPTIPPDPLMYDLRKALASDSARVSSYRDAQPQLKRFLDQLARYLGLIGLTALFVGGLGVATSIHAFIREKLTTIAILKTVGADSATVIGTYLLQALMLGLAGSVIGLAIGVALQQGLPWVVAGLLASDLLDQLGFIGGLTGDSFVPLAKGLALGLLSTLLFTLWPLLTIRDIKPAMIFRRDIIALEPTTDGNLSTWRKRLGLDRVKGMTAIAIGLGLALLSIWQAGSWMVGLLFIGAFVTAVSLLGGATWLAIRLLQRCPRPGNLIIRQALGNILRPGSQAMSISIAIGIGVMVVATVSLVEQSLLRQVGDTRPANAPTFFFIDIQPDQTEGFVHLVRNHPGNLTPELTPLVRSRLSALNGNMIKLEATSADEEPDEQSADKDQRRKHWYLSREYVLTFLEDLPKDNDVIKGQWWNPGQPFEKPLVSIEEDAAKHLGLTLGDTLELDVHGVPLVAEVSSVRRVDWSNFSTNFYMIVSPGALDGAPMTYVATVHVPAAEEAALQEAVVEAFPNVTAINIGEVLDSFSRVLDRLSLAIQAVALFCVLSGALVMAAALAATRYRRLYESVIFKAMGATRSILARTFAIEYAILGTIGGFLGISLASALSWGILATVFDLSWSLQPKILAAGYFATISLTMGVGFLSTYRILGHSPLSVLRQE